MTALDQEIAKLTFTAMAGHKNNWVDDKNEYVVTKSMSRRSCLLDHHASKSHETEIFNVTLATLLHKYGFKGQGITDAALMAVEGLNRKTVLSDSFYRAEGEVKALLASQPINHA